MKERLKDNGLNEAAVPPDLAVNLLRIMLSRRVTMDGSAGYACQCIFHAMALQWGTS